MNKLQDDILQSAGSINEDAKNSLDQPVRSIQPAACKMNTLLTLKELWLFSFRSAARWSFIRIYIYNLVFTLGILDVPHIAQGYIEVT